MFVLLNSNQQTSSKYANTKVCIFLQLTKSFYRIRRMQIKQASAKLTKMFEEFIFWI